MLKPLLYTVGFLLAGCTPAVQAGKDAQAAADHLAQALENTNSVSFYFVSRTGDYSLRGDEFKAESAIEVHRRCGADCKEFMRRVIRHLESGTLATCMPGQQNVLIEVGGAASLLYSYSGRMIEYSGKCYFNEKSIDSTIRSSSFIFQ